MRIWFALALAACSYNPTSTGGDDDVVDPDGQMAYVLPPATLIPGGGVQDGPIQAGLNVVVIDVETNAPIAGATVTIGTFTGTTDAAGVVVLDDATVVGKQTVLAGANGYRPEQWVGVNGANVTIPLAPPLAPGGTAMGQITNFASLPISGGSNHSRTAFILYSREDRATDAANNLDTPNQANFCGEPTCSYTLLSRPGGVSLIASLLDYNDNFSSQTDDDSVREMGWAFRSNVAITTNGTTSGQDLTIISSTDLDVLSIDLGTPPPGLFPAAFTGIESSPTEWLPLIDFDGVQSVPKLSAIPGATSYRLTGFARSSDRRQISIAIRRGFTSTALAMGTWMPVPQNVVATTTSTTFDPVPGATFYSVEYEDLNDNDLVEIVVFDGSTTIAVPAGVSAVAGGDVTVQAFGATLDVTSFGFDADAATITDRVSVRTNAN